MKDSLLKIISNEAFTLNTTSIINFNHLKDKVYSEIANLNHLVGVQVFEIRLVFIFKEINLTEIKQIQSGKGFLNSIKYLKDIDQANLPYLLDPLGAERLRF